MNCPHFYMMNKVDVVSNGSGCGGGGAFKQLHLLFQGLLGGCALQ